MRRAALRRSGALVAAIVLTVSGCAGQVDGTGGVVPDAPPPVSSPILEFPAGTTIHDTAHPTTGDTTHETTDDDSSTSVLFSSPVTVEEFASFMGAELTARGYTVVSNDGYQGLLAVNYTDGTNDVSLTVTQDGSAATGIATVGPHT